MGGLRGKSGISDIDQGHAQGLELPEGVSDLPPLMVRVRRKLVVPPPLLGQDDQPATVHDGGLASFMAASGPAAVARLAKVNWRDGVADLDLHGALAMP